MLTIILVLVMILFDRDKLIIKVQLFIDIFLVIVRRPKSAFGFSFFLTFDNGSHEPILAESVWQARCETCGDTGPIVIGYRSSIVGIAKTISIHLRRWRWGRTTLLNISIIILKLLALSLPDV